MLLRTHNMWQVPMVLVTSWPDAVPEVLNAAMASMKQHKYKLVLGNELMHHGEDLPREERALVSGDCSARAVDNLSAHRAVAVS